ncbi:MAG: CBS domain-containing protein [Legionellales bacterium]|jgi:magnesium transporter
MHNNLVQKFLHTHPEECAREIENFSLDDILVFIKQLHKKDTAALIANLIPSIAAVCFQNLPIETSKEIIKILPLDSLKKILPRIHEELRDVLTQTLPRNQKIALQHALKFSANTVGAFINTHVLFLPLDHTIEQTMNFIRKFPEEIKPWIFCIDNEGKLQGMITLQDILTAQPTQMLNHIMQDCPMILLANTTIPSIALHTIWQTLSILPVTNEEGILLGVLEYNQIVHEIQQLLFSDRNENMAQSLADILFMFSHTTEDILTELSQHVHH